jgi:hypothetical protein
MSSDNLSNVIDKSDYGIKIAKSGFNVNDAQDDDLSFNSSWPSLPIVKVVNSTDETPIAHGLPYPTLAVIIGQSPGGWYNNVFSPISSDSTYVYPGAGTVIIYDLDITTDVDYPYNQRPKTSSSYDNNYGIKVAKKDKDIESDDMRDFMLHTRCGSPMVLAVKTQETVSPDNPNLIQYTSQLGYPSFVFGYVENESMGAGYYQTAPPAGQAYPITFSDGITSYMNIGVLPGSFTGRGSLIILRSPMFSNDPISVVYT